MNHYIATKIAVLDIESCHPKRMQPKRSSLQRNLPKLRVDAANSIRVFGGWTLQIQMGPFQV
jgi:hypothetical protein